MDLLNRAYTQLYERFRSMTPGARLMAALLAVAAPLMAGYELTRPAAADMELPGVAVTANQLPAILTALAEANLKSYDIRETKLFVPRGEEANYLGALAEAKVLPPTLGTAPREAANAGSMWEIGAQRDRERIKIAKQDELNKAICMMPGIESASVLFDEYNPGGLKEKMLTAVALVKPIGANRLDDVTVAAIRNMMAPFVGSRPENVTVSDLNAGGENVSHAVKRSSEQERQADVPATSVPALSNFGQSALNWLGQSWSTLGLIGLALVSLLVLRSMLRSGPAIAAQPATAENAALDEDVAEEEQTGAHRARRPKRFDAASPSFRDELSAIVEDDPETAANVLRSWIGQGA